MSSLYCLAKWQFSANGHWTPATHSSASHYMPLKVAVVHLLNCCRLLAADDKSSVLLCDLSSLLDRDTNLQFIYRKMHCSDIECQWGGNLGLLDCYFSAEQSERRITQRTTVCVHIKLINQSDSIDCNRHYWTLVLLVAFSQLWSRAIDSAGFWSLSSDWHQWQLQSWDWRLVFRLVTLTRC